MNGRGCFFLASVLFLPNLFAFQQYNSVAAAAYTIVDQLAILYFLNRYPGDAPGNKGEKNLSLQ